MIANALTSLRPRAAHTAAALGLLALLCAADVPAASAQMLAPFAPPSVREAQQSARRPRIERKRALADGEKIDLNTAPESELRRLPGIGPKRAEQILALRAKRPFRRVTELRRVRGIGKKTLRRLLPHIQVSPPKRAPRKKAGDDE